MTKKLKKPIAFLTVFAMLVSMLMYFPAGTFGFDFGVRASAAGTITPSQPTSGNGSSVSPYQITSAAELYWFAGLVNGDENVCMGSVTQNRTAYAKLMNDIIVNTDVLASVAGSNTESLNVWTPINCYNGVFDGSGYAIKGLYIDSTEDYIGFFGQNSYSEPSNLNISNLTLEDCYFKGGDYVGGFAGTANFLNMNKCTIKDSRIIGTGIAGGIIGGFWYMSGSGNIIKDSKNDHTYVEGTDTVGGIVGSMYEVTEMSGVTSSGTVVAHQSASKPDDPGFSESLGVGGLIGYLCKCNGTISNCEHSGSVTAEGKRVGGLFGNFGNSYTGLSGGFNVSDCTNNGTVTANNYVGGILGYANSSTLRIENCVNNGIISQNDASTDSKYGIGGIFGYSDSACYKCTNNGTINAPDASNVGGIIGMGSANKCVNNGDITGKYSVGGICGSIYSKYSSVKNCVNTGTVRGTENVGGVCGKLSNNARLTSSYSVGTAEGDEVVGGVLGYMGAQLSYMQYCYFDTAKYAGDAIGYINHTSPNLEVYKMTQSDMEDGTLAYNLSQGDVLAFWVQQLNTDTEPRLSDSLEYTVFANSDGSGYHNHIGGVCNNGCAIVPVKPAQTSEGAYKIGTAEELYWFSLYAPNSDAILLNNIVINSDIENPTIIWKPIGSNYCYTYTGTFDGKGHTVSGVYVHDELHDAGLFGTIAESGTVKNVGVINSSIWSEYVAGGISGRNNGLIIGCFNNATIFSSHTIWAKGICSSGGTIKSSYYLENSLFWDNTDSNGRIYQEDDDEWALPAEAFTSGELACKLNSVGNMAWGQIIEDGYTKDPLPVPNDGTNTVYAGERYHNHLKGETPETCLLCDYPATVPEKDGDVYQIGTLSELYGFAKIVNGGLDTVAQDTAAKGVLTESITANKMLLDASGAVTAASPYKWVPIGNGCEFTGSFDGQGHTISGLYTSASQSVDYAGLFGQIGSTATVKNVGIDDSWFEGTATGGIAASNGGTIEGCFAYNLGTATQNDITASGTVNNCFYLSGGSGAGTAATANQFKKGEVAYKLNADPETPVWGQKIDTDPLPVPVTDANRIYYSNSKYHNHNPNSTYCGNCRIILPKAITPVDGIYTISNEGELLWFANLVNSGATNENTKAVLSREVIIQLNNGLANGFLNEGSYAPWTPIGTTEHPFMGSFDGKCYSVKGLYIGDAQSADFAGLFGVTAASARIENVGIYGCMLSGAVAGGIVANNHGTISGCYTHTIKVTGTTSGDICGQSDGTVERCFYLEGGSGDGTEATAEQFKNGDVAYNLNADPENPVWGQIINSAAEPLPVAITAANKVFFAQNVYHNHSGERCDWCDEILPVPPQVDDNNYYLVANPSHLLWLAEWVNSGHTDVLVKLTDNIKLNSGVLDENGNLKSGTFKEWTPIGTDSNSFNGVFDGNGCTISGLYISGTESKVGLFGTVSGGNITKLHIADSYISGSRYVGAVCGYNDGATISECFVESNVTASDRYGGGVCGYNGGTVSDCFHVGMVKGKDSAGIVGQNKEASKIKNCVNLGNVSGSSCDNICGEGRIASTNDIEKCYYNADLTTYLTGHGEKYSTMQITADDFLPGSSAVWAKTANDYENHKLYYPNLKSISLDPVEVEYTPAFNLDIENADPIYYGDDLVFNYEAKLTVYGKDTTVTDQLDYTVLMGLDFVIESNGEVLYNEFTVSIGSIDGKSVLWLISDEERIGYIDISGLTHSITIIKDLNVGEYVFKITYNGTGIPLFSGMSGEYTLTIVQATPTVEEPTASAIDYGETLNESVLNDTGWSWVDPDIIPKVANNG
ncbi:MAG: hypothetical protein ACI4KM_02515, partial [Oscillospiraceae bacterium]